MSPPRILVMFHTSEGQTAKIADRMAQVLRGAGASVDVHPAAVAPGPQGYDGVVVGSPIRYSHHGKEITRYLKRHVVALDEMPSAFFQVSMTSANSDEQHTAAAKKVVDKLLDATGFRPAVVGYFAGAMAYTKYGWFIRRIMRMMAKREGGSTDTSRDHEYTDWGAVERFAHEVLECVFARGAQP